MGHIRAASLDTNRLQSVLAFLRERGERGATTLEIVERCKVLAPNTAIAELRERGIPVSKAKSERETDTGRRVFRYVLSEDATPPGEQRPLFYGCAS